MKKVPEEDHKEEPNGAGFFFCHRYVSYSIMNACKTECNLLGKSEKVG